jgi:hypothetical protein
VAAPDTVLTRRELNRALLARQLLLSRDTLAPVKALEHLAGLQAQLPRPPCIGLWSRLKDFDRSALVDAIQARTVVRVTAMRGTLHLLSARDYRSWRGALQPALNRGLTSIVGAALKDMDLPRAEAETRAYLAASPAQFDLIRDHLEPRHPGVNVRHLAYALRLTVPLVQVPEADATWGYPGAADFALADQWLGKPVSTAVTSPAALVRRYLAAFGPATVADAQAWSGLPTLAPVFETLRSELVTFRDERKRELFDLRDAPRPPADTPAPVRLVPDWDNVLLGHQDRRRIIADEHRARISTRNLQVTATFLVDGMVAGSWSITRKGRDASLVLEPFVKVAKKDQATLREEAEQLLAFAEPDAGSRRVDVRL